MNKKTINLILAALLIGLAAFELFHSVTNSEQAGDNRVVNGESLRLVHNPWDTEVASSTVLALVLEEAGYDVSLVSVDNAIMFESLANGESDLMTAAWLPITHGSIIEEYADRLVDLGENLVGAKSGLVVPTYMEVESIRDLDTQANQTIMGIEPGAGIMIQTEEALNHYNNISGWTLEAPSTGAMLASLSSAIDAEDEIIVTGWTPHWMFQSYDLKYLEDPDNIYGDSESIHTMVRLGFQDDHPEAYAIADAFMWTVDDMESVTLNMQNGMEAEDAAREWIEANRDRVDEWLAAASQ